MKFVLPLAIVPLAVSGCLGATSSDPTPIANEELSLPDNECQIYGWEQDGPMTLVYDLTVRIGRMNFFVMDRGEEDHACDGGRFRYYPDVGGEAVTASHGSEILGQGKYAILLTCVESSLCRATFKAHVE